MSQISTPLMLGQAIRARRTELQLTQRQLAAASGVGERFLVELEAGKPTVRLDRVFRVMAALNLRMQLDATAPSRHIVSHDELDINLGENGSVS